MFHAPESDLHDCRIGVRYYLGSDAGTFINHGDGVADWFFSVNVARAGDYLPVGGLLGKRFRWLDLGRVHQYTGNACGDMHCDRRLPAVSPGRGWTCDT